MKHFPHHEPQLFGTATIGEKGQIVIPVEARKKLGLKTGDKLIVIGGPHDHALMLMRPEQIMEIAAGITAGMNRMLAQLQSEPQAESGAEASENPDVK